MAASLLTVKSNSLLPSQSIFTEVHSILETGYIHEMESMGKDCVSSMVSQGICLQCYNNSSVLPL